MKRSFLFGLLFLILFSYGVLAQQITVQLGPEQTVFDWTTQRCETEDIPDVPARAFRDINGNVQVIATHYINRRFIGSSLNNIVRTCPVVLSSSLNSNPSQYNDHEWLTSLYTLDGQTIYGLVHNEYQGYLYNSCTSYASCWYNAITSALSTDAGATYTQATAPNHLVASVPYQYVNNVGYPYGIFEPSNIIYKDGYYYSLLHLEGYQSQQVGSCLMRTNNLANPTSWRFWNGNSFANTPVNPYTSTITNANSHLCTPVAPSQIGKMSNSLTWNTYLQKYVLVGVHQTSAAAADSGFFYSLSDDLINWGSPQLIMTAILPWMSQAQGTGGGQWQLYPSLLEETSSRSFELTGQTPYLYYTKKNPNSAELYLDRDLVRRQVTFTISNPPAQFDFALANSGAINLAQGGSSSNTITATLISGTAQSVTFSVSGLPSGATSSFNQGSCSPTCSVQLTINTVSSIGVGNYPIIVTAVGGGVTRTANFNLAVSDSAPPSAPGSHYGSTISQSQIQIAWGAATDNVGVTGYIVDVSTSASFASYVSGWQGNNVGNILSTTISNLNSGTTYYSRVRARDAAGNVGAYSQTVSTATLPQATPFDFGLSSTNPSSVSQGNNLPVSVNANLISGTAQPVTFSVGNLPAGVTANITPQSCTVSCSVNIILFTSINTSVQTHTVSITAVGGGLNNNLIISFAVTPLVDTILPSALPSISSMTASQNIIQLAWGAATDNVGVTGYIVDVSTSPNFPNFATGWFNREVGLQLNAQVSGLTPNTTYYSRVKARDAAGNVGPHIFTGPVTTLQQTMPPQLPTIPLVTDITYNSAGNFVSLKWTDSSYEQEYSIERSVGEGAFVLIATLSADVTTHIDYSVSPGNSYLYRIRAVNSAGVSEYSFGGIVTNSNTLPVPPNPIVPASNIITISQPSRYLSGALEYSWNEDYQEIKILVSESPFIESLVLRPLSTSPSRRALISSYGSSEDFSEDINNIYDLKYFFALDIESFQGNIEINLKIPLENIENLNKIFLIAQQNENLQVQQLEFISQDDSYAYYTSPVTLPSEGRYAVGQRVVSPYRNYLWTGAIALVLLILIIVLVKIIRQGKNSNKIVNSALAGRYK